MELPAPHNNQWLPFDMSQGVRPLDEHSHDAPFPRNLLLSAYDQIGLQRETLRNNRPPARINQIVFKIASRCNLACDYCYEFFGPDQSWRLLPHFALPETVGALGRAAGEYAAMHELDALGICLHGGEPLLMKPDRIVSIVEELRSAIGRLSPATTLHLSMQTNGELLTEPNVLETLARCNVSVGVSLDGDEVSHNRHRVNKGGEGSYDAVVRGVEALRKPAYRHLFAGLLCVVDIQNDPLDVYNGLMAFEPPDIDLLLPYGKWDEPPYGLESAHIAKDTPWTPWILDNIRGNTKTPYADWLISIYDAWNDSSAPTTIRLFDSIHKLLLGGYSSTEAIGPETGGELVVRSDGAVELADGLKWARDGAVNTGMNILHDSIETVAELMRSQHHLGRKALANVCKVCPFGLTEICSGGHISNRYSEEREFDNPSVYCLDLAATINYIRRAITPRLINAQASVDVVHEVEAWKKRTAQLLNGQATTP